MRFCTFDNCVEKHKAKGYCNFHYRRHKRNVPLNFVRPILDKKRYKQIKDFSCPIANKDGRVYLHRKILFDSIGFDFVPCFWCGLRLIFGENLVVDHLDNNRHNNALINLVPSCNSCNAGRTRTSSNVRKSIYLNYENRKSYKS